MLKKYYLGRFFLGIHTGQTVSKHSGFAGASTAYSHGRDFDHVLKLEEFQSIVKNEGEAKPVAMIFLDGGPDENPCFPKTLDVAVQHFKKHKFDALLISSHALSTTKWREKWLH